jgi:adenine-specific DNA-methyltransferase
MDPRNDPFLTTQYLAYLGNKRPLLPFLEEVFNELVPDPCGKLFGDLFAGTGSVSRLALSMGFDIHANDWEDYSVCVNKAWLGCRAGDGGPKFSGLLDKANRFHPDLDGTAGSSWDSTCLAFSPYISRHYAPARTVTADYRSERLFYTQENALFIDRVRSWIEGELAPGSCERTLLLGLLLYECARQANTNGVFKSFHRGFGGHGRNALDRIMARMRLPEPILLDGGGRADISDKDACDAVAGRSYELVYLDPPYNIHQYGSNYFLLNSIYRWDRPRVSEQRYPDGRLVWRAGIREDWVRTRSDWCLRNGARPALTRLLATLDTRYVVLSYNADGIIGPEEMLDLLSGFGSVSVRSVKYPTYRGGRQSLARDLSTAEYIYILDRRHPPGGARLHAKPGFGDALQRSRLARLFAATHHPERLSSIRRDISRLLPPAWLECRFDRPPKKAAAAISSWLAAADAPLMDEATVLLESSACHTWAEEFTVWLGICQKDGLSSRDQQYCYRRLLHCLSKLAYAKYRVEFTWGAAAIDGLVAERPVPDAGLSKGLAGLRERYRLREAHHLARSTKKDRDTVPG